jgi:hypothetical protein
MLNYFLRKPKYPVICDVDGSVIAAKSEKSFLKYLAEISIDPEKKYNLLDANAEGWVFMPQYMAVSPLTLKKQWSKKELIAIFNNRKNLLPDGAQYSEKSLSSKRYDKIFGDIVELLLKSFALKRT